MIRLIYRKLIIPRGDTGTFKVPLLCKKDMFDLAIFYIFDPLTRTRILEKQAAIQDDALKVSFFYHDTINLKPGKYLWDIQLYKNPLIIDDVLIDSDEAHSYYAGFSLPACEIKETGGNYFTGNNTTLSSNELNMLSSTIKEVKKIANQIQSDTSHYPIIQDNYWYIWNAVENRYINTNVKANGDSILISASLEENNSKLKLIFNDGEIKIVPFSGVEHPEEQIIYDGGTIDPIDTIIYDGGCIDDGIHNFNDVEIIKDD